MAITLTTEPADIVASYRPVEWEVTSDRFGGGVHPVSSVSSGGGGVARYTNATITHNFVVGDVITGTTFATAQYNVRQEITAIIDTKTYETNVAFVSTDTGTMTRTNDRFQIKADIFATDTEPLKTIEQISASAGQIRIDITDHGYSVGDFIEIVGTTSYDGFHKIASVVSTISFKVALAFVADEAGTVQKLSTIGTTSRQSVLVAGVDTFRFDISTYIQSLVTFDLPVATGNDISTPNPGSIKVYIIKFIEQFNDKDGLLQDKDTLESSLGDKFTTNITLQHLEVQNLTAFTGDTSSKRFLTNLPADQPLARDEFIHLAFLTSEPSLKIRIAEFDAAGASTLTTTALKTIVDSRGVMRIDASTLLASTVRVQLFLLNSAESKRSETIQFIIDEKCYDQITRVWWLNRLGGMDSFTLTGDIKERIKTKITSYERRIGSGFTVDKRGTTALGVKNSEVFDVFTDFVSINQQTWLSELITSPVVFLQQGSNMVPIINLSKTVTRKDGDSLKQMKFSYTLSNNPIIQTN